MVEKSLAEQHLRIVKIGEKSLYIVDHHQYVLLIWAQEALKRKQKGTLVSIDFHPDTNPPFWLNAYQKAMAVDPEREETLVPLFQKRILEDIDPDDLATLIQKMPLMRNDEHINTALTLGYLEDYHMINCMEKHNYSKGHHYLVPEENFGDLRDRTFKSAGFDFSFWENRENREGFLILDIDLDYFMKKSDFVIAEDERHIFKTLIEEADVITSARSTAYFEYLRKEDFGIEECEAALVTMLTDLLEK